ncbi:hypothetical protein [Streptomyces zaomyceticus]|uniref:hypothetical protein n=1 Tax=Streptomyces zaomyceticus TaxID=68286 RepID=UPI002E22084B
MDEEQGLCGDAALGELRRRLGEELAGRRLAKTQLAARAGLGRTTVQEAFSENGPIPSEQTVAALADALGLAREKLLGLRRRATRENPGTGGREEQVGEDVPRLGRPIGAWDPHALEVHPAGPAVTVTQGAGGSGVRVLSRYVRREHDRVLAEAVREAGAGRSRIVVLVGSSSTGKTRACWEAVQPLANQGWRLWHPFDPTRAQAALEDLHHVGPRTVVWLNEAQHYLGDREYGERIAAALHHLLVTPEGGPILVLGTLWPEYAHQYKTLPSPGMTDPHSRVRELLSTSTLSVPEFFDASALAVATKLARDGDVLLADTLTRAAADGRVAQDLAGAPALLDRLHDATPPARVLLEAAMDARRLGMDLHLPQAFLTDAAVDYLTDAEYDDVADGWTEQAYAELARPVHGKQSPLRLTTPRPTRRPAPPAAPPLVSHQPAGPMVRLADFLEQHGRITRSHMCPPASFWHAVYTHITHPNTLDEIAEAAENRHRLQWAHHLFRRAAVYGSDRALRELTSTWEKAGDQERVESLYRQAADLGNTDALYDLAWMRKEAGDREGAEALYRQAADLGNTDALYDLAWMRKEAGDREGAEALRRRAADLGNTYAICSLALTHEKAGDQKGAEALYQKLSDISDTRILNGLARTWEEAGDRESAELFCRKMAELGNTNALYDLARTRKKAGDLESAEVLYRQAVDFGNPYALEALARMREEAGDWEGAESFYQQAADHGDTSALRALARMREVAGNRVDAEFTYRALVELGDFCAVYDLARMWEETGDHENAEAIYESLIELGNTDALYRLVKIWEKAGKKESYKTLCHRLVDCGDVNGLSSLAAMREDAGDHENAEFLYRQAANLGDTSAMHRLTRMREKAGDPESAEALCIRAVELGSIHALSNLAEMRESAGNYESAEALYRQAVDLGDTSALYDVARMRENAGDRKSAEALYLQMANFGRPRWGGSVFDRLWPYGLDPDGTPTPQWETS